MSGEVVAVLVGGGYGRFGRLFVVLFGGLIGSRAGRLLAERDSEIHSDNIREDSADWQQIQAADSNNSRRRAEGARRWPLWEKGGNRKRKKKRKETMLLEDLFAWRVGCFGRSPVHCANLIQYVFPTYVPT